jgi:hypothetical protein
MRELVEPPPVSRMTLGSRTIMTTPEGERAERRVMRSTIQLWDETVTRTIEVVLSAVILSGCHSRVPIVVPVSMPPPPTSAVFTELKAEDNVRVTLWNGNTEVFVVAEAQAEALVAADGRRFLYADIAVLEKRHVSKAKTIALIVAMPFMMLILVGLTTVGP